MKYKGTYRLKAAIDQNTNDYPRDDSGGIDSVLMIFILSVMVVLRYIIMVFLLL